MQAKNQAEKRYEKRAIDWNKHVRKKSQQEKRNRETRQKHKIDQGVGGRGIPNEKQEKRTEDLNSVVN